MTDVINAADIESARRILKVALISQCVHQTQGWIEEALGFFPPEPKPEVWLGELGLYNDGSMSVTYTPSPSLGGNATPVHSKRFRTDGTTIEFVTDDMPIHDGKKGAPLDPLPDEEGMLSPSYIKIPSYVFEHCNRNNTSYHLLKIYSHNFQEIIDGKKLFEIRWNDRCFLPRDIVILQEFEHGKYTGRRIIRQVGGLTSFEQKPGYVVFSLLRVEKESQ